MNVKRRIDQDRRSDQGACLPVIGFKRDAGDHCQTQAARLNFGLSANREVAACCRIPGEAASTTNAARPLLDSAAVSTDPSLDTATDDISAALSPWLPRSRLKRLGLWALATLALALSGCASFTVPLSDNALRAEDENCAKSSLCRLLIEDRPPALVRASNDARFCETNARIAESILNREGIETRRYQVRLPSNRKGDFKTAEAQTQLLHTFVGANLHGKWYAVDNGALPFCDRICRLSEALHGVELIQVGAPTIQVDLPIVSSR
jgi:hypothetical protein